MTVPGAPAVEPHETSGGQVHLLRPVPALEASARRCRLILPQTNAAIRAMLQEPWDLLAAATDWPERLRLRQTKDIEQLGAAESRIRQDYHGRYPIELLQNAHDACADEGEPGRAWLRITDTALLVANQGTPFDVDRTDALMQLGASTKSESRHRHHTIGYKGIGFSSVFEISDNPQIISADAAFQFDRARATARIAETLGFTPKRISVRGYPLELTGNEVGEDLAAVAELLDAGAVTVVRLPLRPGVSAAEVEAHVRRALTPETLLFMPSLKALTVEGQDGAVTWTISIASPIGSGRLHHLESSAGERRSWLVARARVPAPRDAVAALDDDLWRDVAELGVAAALPWKPRAGPDPQAPPANLHLYFPTDDRLGRRLLIHGDFYIDSSRRRIASKGAGGKISEAVAGAAADLAADLAESVAERGEPLLACLALDPSSPPSGFGERFGELLVEALRERRLLRSADDVYMPSALRRLPSHLDIEIRKRLATMILGRETILRPEDDSPRSSALLDEVGCAALSPHQVAAQLDPCRSALPYDTVLATLASWVGTLSAHHYPYIRAMVETRPVVKDDTNRWRPPSQVVASSATLPLLPAKLQRPLVARPRTQDARRFVDWLELDVLSPASALDDVLSALADGRLDDEGRDAEEALHFIRDLWTKERSQVEALRSRLRTVPVPVRTMRGDARGWRPAGQTYFGRDWSNDAALEDLYGAIGEAEFLAQAPPKDAALRRRTQQFFELLGVAGRPRDIALAQGWQSWSWGWTHDPRVDAAHECPDRHPNTPRRREGHMVDRLPLLLEDPRIKRSQALARLLAESATPFGGQAKVWCPHSAHSNPRKRPVPGPQQWLLEDQEWVPVRDDPVGKDFRRPSEAWGSIPRSLAYLQVPRAKLSRETAERLGLVDASRPSVDAIEAALTDLAEAHPDLASAPPDVERTAWWLAGRLRAALAHSHDVREAPPLPAYSGTTLVWSAGPVIPDIDGLDAFDSLIRLPAGDWSALARAYRLAAASTVVEVRLEAIPVRRRRPRLLSSRHRCALEHILAPATDVSVTKRLARLVEVPCGELRIDLLFNGQAATVALSHHLEPQRNKAEALDGARLYVGPNACEFLRALAGKIAEYIGLPQHIGTVLSVLRHLEEVVSDYEISEEDLEAARERLARFQRQRDEPLESEDEVEEPALDDDAGADEAAGDFGSELPEDAPAPATAAMQHTSTPTSRGSASGSRESSESSQSSASPAGGAGGTDESSRQGEGRTAAAAKPGGQRQSESSDDRQMISYLGRETEQSQPLDPDEQSRREEIDRQGVQLIVEQEAAEGRSVRRMAQNHPGYDLLSTVPDGDERYIEVKSVDGSWGARGVGLTARQYDTNVELGSRYWLYVVEHARSDHPRVHRIQDPAAQVDRYYLDNNWAALSG